MELLNKIRELNRHLQRTLKNRVNFDELSKEMSHLLNSNVFILSKRGRLLGNSVVVNLENERLEKMIESKQFPEEYNDAVLKLEETVDNIDINNDLTAFPIESKTFIDEGWTTISPIIGGGERLGTLILSRVKDKFNEEDLVLIEHTSIIVSSEILREKQSEIEEEARNKAIVQLAMSSLSYSEIEAIENVFEALGNKEGILVASKVADKTGITRSVIVNALRKLEGSGVIESRSLGMKGTYIKVLNENLLNELKKMKMSH